MTRLSTLLSALVFLFVSSQVFSGDGFHGKHHWMKGHHLSMDTMTESMDLSENQQALLMQVDAAHLMLTDMMTNIAANSLDENGDFDRGIFKVQMAQNSLVVDEYKDLMMAFKDSLSDEQLSAWAELIKENKRGCRDKNY